MSGNQEWSCDAFHNKAVLYFDKMVNIEKSSFEFGLWALLAFEYIVKASVSNVNPTLLADLKSNDNLLFALGIPVTTPKFVPKTADMNELVKRLEKSIPEFQPDHTKMAIYLTKLRNKELHSSSSVFNEPTDKDWLPKYFQLLDVLLVSYDKQMTDIFPDDFLAFVQTLVTSFKDKQASAVQGLVNSYKTIWNQLNDDEQEEKRKTAEAEARPSIGHVIKCPSCDCKAILKGKAISEAKVDIEDGEVCEKHEMLPSNLECFACQLKISGHSKLYSIGFGDTFNSSSYYSINEYYPDEYEHNEHDGYEDFFND